MRKVLLGVLLLLNTQGTGEDVFVMNVMDGSSFAIYEDENCINPVLEEGEPVLLVSEDGRLTIPAAYKGMWLRETKTGDGCYPMSEPVEIKEDMEIVQEPIHFVVSLFADGVMKESVFELVDEEGNASEVIIEDSMDIGPYLSAGKNYTLHEVSIPEEYARNGDVAIEVPLKKPDEEWKLDLFYERRTVLLFKGQDDCDAGIMLYKDEAGEEPLKEDGFYHVDKKIYLDEGTYWYRIEESNPMYYENKTMYKLDIDPSSFQYMEEPLLMERVKFVVQMEESPYIIHVFHEGKETASFEADGKDHILYGLRDSAYTIQAKALHDGYDLKDVHIQTGSTNEGKTLVLRPEFFTVNVRIVDTYRNTYLSGTVIVKDDSGQEVARVETDGSYAAVSGLIAKQTYWIEALETKTLHSEGKTKLVVDGDENYCFDVSAFTDVTLSIQTPDKDARFSLYKDEECTILAHDQNNKALEDIPSGSYTLLPATYFLRQTGSGETYYRHTAVMKLEVNSNLSTVVPTEEVHVTLGAKEADMVVPLMRLELLENGELIERWQGEKTFTLKRGRVYTLRQAAPLSGYLTAEEVLFSAPEQKPDKEVSHYLSLHAYTVLTLRGEENVGAKLYADETCMYPAYDVDGLIAEVRMDESGIERLRMPKGTYYLLETGGAGFYDTGEIRKVELASPYVETSLSPVPVSFSICFLDIGKQPVQGAVFSLRDEAGNVLEEWVSGTEPYRIQSKLIAGGAYIIHQDKAPEGYERMKTDIVYTTPLNAPETMPVLTIEAKQYASDGNVKNTAEIKDMEEVRNAKQTMLVYTAGGAGVVLLMGILFKNRRRKQ